MPRLLLLSDDLIIFLLVPFLAYYYYYCCFYFSLITAILITALVLFLPPGFFIIIIAITDYFANVRPRLSLFLFFIIYRVQRTSTGVEPKIRNTALGIPASTLNSVFNCLTTEELLLPFSDSFHCLYPVIRNFVNHYFVSPDIKQLLFITSLHKFFVH